MPYQRVIRLVEKYAVETGMPFQEILAKFYRQFHDNLRAVAGELAGELAVLKERQLNPKPFKALVSVHNELIGIINSIQPNNPYIAAEKLVHTVLGSGAIDRLNAVAKNHLAATNIEFKSFPSVELRHPEMHSLDKLKILVARLQDFMTKHSMPSIEQAETALEDVPAFTAGRDEATKH